MSAPFDSARHQAALSTPTGYRRWMRFVFFRGGQSIELEPISGSLVQDARRDGRWSGSLSFVGNDILPRRPGDILTPFGTRVSVELGLELLDGSVATVPYGVYEITSSSVDESADQRRVEVSLADVSGIVDRYRFESEFTVASGTDLGTMIDTVVTNRTGLNPGVGAIGVTLGAQRIYGLDLETGPWAELLDVISGFSRTAWYDRVGDIQVGSTEVDPDTAYAISSTASLSADFDTRPPNVVVVRGEYQLPIHALFPLQAVALDSDPSSPTYAGTGPGTSPYGRVTMFYSSPLINSLPQAQSAADSLLAANLGAGATYTITLPYDPTISAGDVISAQGLVFAVDAVRLDLTGETSLQVRELG